MRVSRQVMTSSILRHRYRFRDWAKVSCSEIRGRCRSKTGRLIHRNQGWRTRRFCSAVEDGERGRAESHRHCSVTVYLTAARVGQRSGWCVAPAMHPPREKAPGCRELESDSSVPAIGSCGSGESGHLAGSPSTSDSAQYGNSSSSPSFQPSPEPFQQHFT